MRDQVRPSNFLLAYQIDPVAIHECPDFLAGFADADSSRAKPIKWPKPVAPYDTDPAKAAENCFDRDTGIAIPAGALKTYGTALAQYHLRPEHKFRNGDYTDRGKTERRRVEPSAIRQIGKESNRWEEQFYLGGDDGPEIDYGSAPSEPKPMIVWLREQIAAIGQRRAAKKSGLARRTIERLMQGKKVRDATIARILRTFEK